MVKPKFLSLGALLTEVRACAACSDLPCGPRPIVQIHQDARVLIVGQAPGRIVHATGVPWNDRSGDRLRQWMGVDRETFYGPRIAIIPMGLCYPGSGPDGDLPPRAQCAPLWFGRLRAFMPGIALTLLIGRYAQRYHLHSGTQAIATTVRAGPYYDHFWPLPHPSGRNNRWFKQHPWFEGEVLQKLQDRVRAVLSGA